VLVKPRYVHISKINIKMHSWGTVVPGVAGGAHDQPQRPIKQVFAAQWLRIRPPQQHVRMAPVFRLTPASEILPGQLRADPGAEGGVIGMVSD
jgi:hypothetical protein